MHPSYGMANPIYEELTVDDCRSSTLHTPDPNHSGHYLLQQYYYSQFQQPPQQKQRQNEHVYQMCQYPLQFQASQEQSPYLGESTARRVSFWKAFNTVLSDAKGKPQQGNENERCMVSENLGELEAVYTLAQTKETTQSGSDSALAVENSHTVATLSARATTGVDNVLTSEAFFPKQASMKRARKKMRKKKMKKEMGLMTEFFKRLVKRVITHQDVLQNKFSEVIERLDKERAEREEAWRRKESEIYEREAIAKAQERDLASRRESCIVSYIEKITGQSFIFVSGNTRNQLSTEHEN